MRFLLETELSGHWVKPLNNGFVLFYIKSGNDIFIVRCFTTAEKVGSNIKVFKKLYLIKN